MVLKNEFGYEMWYTGSNISNFFVCYATSMDGETWTKSDSRPTFHESPPWHTDGWYLGKSVLKTNLVNHMWFTHSDNLGGRPQIGYAQDFNRIIHADSLWINQSYVKPISDSLLIYTRIENSRDHLLEVEAYVESDDRLIKDLIMLSSDDLNSNIWKGTWSGINEEKNFTLLNLKVSDLDTGSIVIHQDSIYFTTIGPIKVENYSITSSDTIPNHGDILWFKLNLKNDGSFVTASDISIEATNIDTCTSITYFSSPKYGNIGVGEVVEPSRAITIKFNEKCPDSHPNPFNPITKILYQLPVASDVSLNIYNLLGQKVTAIVNEYQRSGDHQVEWDASRFSSGIYYYRIEVRDPEKRTVNYQDVKKMILIK